MFCEKCIKQVGPGLKDLILLYRNEFVYIGITQNPYISKL